MITNCRKLTSIIGLIGILLVSSDPLSAQDHDITNEYRLTLVTSKPVSEKVILFAYLGIVRAPDKSVGTLYYSPPGVIYKPRRWVELWAGAFGLYNNNKNASNSWEIRPIAGVKFYVPNDKKVNLYNFTRYEYRLINQDNNTQSIPRFRNRVGIEVPLSNKEKAWTPKTFYALGDVEPIWRLDDKFLQLIRVRGGVGYILNKHLRAEFIYHAEMSGPKGHSKDYTGNIWRLNFKLNLPKKGKHQPHPVDIDE